MSDCVKIEIVSQGRGLRRRVPVHPYVQLHFRVSAVHFVQLISDSLGVIFILQNASMGENSAAIAHLIWYMVEEKCFHLKYLYIK